MRETFLYDPHCEFCMRGVRWAKQRGVDVDALAYTDANLASWGLTAADAQREAWLVSDRRVCAGADAVLGVLQHGPTWLARIATVIMHTPLIFGARWTYRWVAANRHLLGWMFRSPATL